MKSIFLSLFVLLIFSSCTKTQLNDEDLLTFVESVKTEDIKHHIAVLANDSMKGRLPGTPEYKIAMDYVANQFQEFDFPKDWQLLYGINSTHTDEQLYPNTNTFNPDRFESTPQAAVAKYGYVPFGGGMRECLGKEFARLELKLFAIHLLKTVDWTLHPNQDLSFTISPTPVPKDGLQVSFRPYSKNGA